MNRVKKTVIGTGIVLVFMMVWGYFNIWRSPKYFMEINTCDQFQNILTMEQYGQLTESHERSYIINRKNVLIFGSEHIKDPENEQNNRIELAFNQFKPTVVLVEGRLGFLIPYFMNPVQYFGEMGKAGELAKKNNIPLYSWDAPKSEQINSLLNKFKPEQLALKEILTPYFSNLRFGKPESPEKYVEQYLFRAEWLGVQDKINSIADIDSIWKRDFSAEKDWRNISDQWGLPGYLAEIADHANYIRNEYLVCAIKQLLNQGERVFVICGSSHAVCVEKEFI